MISPRKVKVGTGSGVDELFSRKYPVFLMVQVVLVYGIRKGDDLMLTDNVKDYGETGVSRFTDSNFGIRYFEKIFGKIPKQVDIRCAIAGSVERIGRIMSQTIYGHESEKEIKKKEC
jgi:hypothetical protein